MDKYHNLNSLSDEWQSYRELQYTILDRDIEMGELGLICFMFDYSIEKKFIFKIYLDGCHVRYYIEKWVAAALSAYESMQIDMPINEYLSAMSK